MKSALTGLVFLLTLLLTHAQTPKTTPGNSCTPQQLQQDFGLTRQLFETMHPALYEVVAKEKLDHLWDSTSRVLDHTLTAFEFFNLLSPIISQLGCGHTAVGLPTSDRGYINRYVPVKVKYLSGKAYIVASQDNSPSLLGWTCNSILEILFRLPSGRGKNEIPVERECPYPIQ